MFDIQGLLIDITDDFNGEWLKLFTASYITKTYVIRATLVLCSYNMWQFANYNIKVDRFSSLLHIWKLRCFKLLTRDSRLDPARSKAADPDPHYRLKLRATYEAYASVYGTLTDAWQRFIGVDDASCQSSWVAMICVTFSDAIQVTRVTERSAC